MSLISSPLTSTIRLDFLFDENVFCFLTVDFVFFSLQMERKTYEVVMEGGKLFYKQTGELLDTTAESKDKWIFVLSTTKNLYVGKKKKGTFQHSSFLAGGAASAAGRLVVENGTLKVYIHESFLDSHLFTCSSLEIDLFPNFYLFFL